MIALICQGKLILSTSQAKVREMSGNFATQSMWEPWIKAFWKEVKKINNCSNISIANSIDNVIGKKENVNGIMYYIA